MSNLIKNKQYRDYFEQLAKDNREKLLEPYKVEFDELSKEKKKIYDKWLEHMDWDDPEHHRLHTQMEKIERDIASIIIDLLKKEPSHLAEPWVLWTVIHWMDRIDRVDFLTSAFIEQKGRYRPTDDQTKKEMDDDLLRYEIWKIQRENRNCSISKACDILAARQSEKATRKDYLPQWDDNNADQDLSGTIRKRFYKKSNIKKRINSNKLPNPYWGRHPRPKDYPSTMVPRKIY